MRLDKYLKVSRLIKRRTVANEIISQGRIFINDKTAKPANTVNEGDKIRLEYYNKTVIVEIVKVPAGNISVQEAKDLYKIIKETHKKES